VQHLVSDFQSLVTVDTDAHERGMSSRVIKLRKEANFRGILQPVVIPRCLLKFCGVA